LTPGRSPIAGSLVVLAGLALLPWVAMGGIEHPMGGIEHHKVRSEEPPPGRSHESLVVHVRSTPSQLPLEQASGTIDHVKGRGALFYVFGCLGNTL